jgi:glycosyltransferase involved in cell wall biosynthesis
MHIGFLTPEYVSPSSFDGGLANYVRKVGLALIKCGHQVSVFVISNRNACYQDDQITVHEVKRVTIATWVKRFVLRAVSPALMQVLSSRRLASVVWKIHRDRPLDILQATSYLSPGYALLRNGRVPLVCRISSYTPLLRSAYGRSRNLGEYLNDWLEIRQVLDADASFAPSRFMAAVFARFEGCQPQIIHTPVDMSAISTDPSYYQSHLAGTPYLLFFGTLSRIKGLDLLVDVIPQVLEQHENLNFVFVGRDDGLPGGEKMFAYLRSHCKTVAHRLQYHSPLPKILLYPIIANALGVLMPSRVDNYPNSCLEAQSLGVPVVGTYDSSLDEMIVDGQTGFLAKNGDGASLCEAIERLLALTSVQREQMRQQILESVRLISSEDRIGQLLSFYETTISGFQRLR